MLRNKPINRRHVLSGGVATSMISLLSACSTIDQPPRSMKRKTEPKQGIRRQYVDGRFGQMHIYKIEPPQSASVIQTPLVCFHPTAASGDYFKDFMLEMGVDRTVIAIDTPGYGRSSAPPKPQSMSELAGAAADALDALGYGNAGKGAVDVIGYHTGCFIASELAILRPDLVRRVVLPGIPYYTGNEQIRMYEENAKHKPLTEDGSYAQSVWEFWVTHRNPDVTLERGFEHFTDHLQSSPRSWWAYHGVFTYDAERRFPLITQPVFIPNTHGSLKDQTRAAALLIKNVELVEMPDLDTGIFDIGTQRIASAIRPFLD